MLAHVYVKIPHSEVLGLRMGRNGQMERSISIGLVQPKKVLHLERWLNGKRPMTPEISQNLSSEQRASDGVYFRVIDTETNILLCLSAPTLDKLKIWQRQILSRYLEGP